MALAQPNYASQEIAVFSRVGKNWDLRDKEKGFRSSYFLETIYWDEYYYVLLWRTTRSSKRTGRLWMVDFPAG
jgi:hypothetical protein